MKIFLDIVSDATLLYNFGIAPTIRDAELIATRTASLYHYYHQMVENGGSISFTAHGKFTYLFKTEEFPIFPGARLVVRTKAKFRVHPGIFLTAILPIRAYGLLPDFENVWDLIPFSFVLDWFTSVGQYLEIVDNGLLMLALDPQLLTHSLTWSYDYSTEDQSAYGFTSQSDSTGYATYTRFVSGSMPLYLPSSLDFIGNPVMPLASSAALLYKFL